MNTLAPLTRHFPTIAAVALIALAGCAHGGSTPASDALRAPAPDTSTASPAASPAALRTRAERTDYVETSRYADVVAFVDAVAAASPRIHRITFGYSYDGRPLPLVVYGDVADASPEAALESGKTRVFIQANIHGGEVEGKEAMLQLLRMLAEGVHARWADSLVLLIAPIYNADGNDAVSMDNRTRQYGPFGGVGTRANAQGYDLNRDHVKLDSPEAHALVRLFDRYDPHLVIDLHTTNGTYHAYHLTYSVPMHPNTDSTIVRRLREEWIPALTRSIRQEYGWDFFYYGNLGPEDARGWYTFDYRPRFNNNYVGLRNRFAILSEAYAYLPFSERIEVTLRFVEAILDYAWAHAAGMRATTQAADSVSVVGRELTLRARFARSEEAHPILLGEVKHVRNPYNGRMAIARVDASRVDTMDVYGTFAPTETTRAPAAYLVPAELDGVVGRLEAHGVEVRALERETALDVERFRIDSTWVSPREYQGHHERDIAGEYESARLTVPAGTLVVPVDQPLGRLVFTMLEPRAADGLLHWNVLDEALEGAEYYPVLRTHQPIQ